VYASGVNGFWAVLLAASALAQARAHLAAGKLDAVLLDLQQPGEAPAEEAKVLAAAAEAAKARKDEPLALQLAQVAQKRDPSQTRAARLLGEWSLAAREFGQAQRYAALWVKAAPADEDARRFELKVKLLEESWHPALLDPPKRRGKLVRRQLKDIAQEDDLSAPYRSAHAATPLVTVYGTAWCPACRAARGYLLKRHIPFTDLDIEKNAAARRDLAEKQAKAGVHYGGVPVIDVNGTLMEGFSSSAIDAALLR
jgi:glutaredoxin